MPTQSTLWRSGQDGYHTYRIPALAVTTAGTALAFCEGRRNSRHDHGEIDLLVRRSTDNGDSWSEPRVVVAGSGQTAGNPAPVVDRMTGRIWLPFVRNDPLGTVERVVRRESWRHPYMTFSDDDGRTWAEPIDVKDQVMEPAWTWYAFGPGHSIQLASGRLLIPCNHMPRSGRSRDDVPFRSVVVYSDDAGASWHIGAAAADGTDESIAVELDDGSLYLNSRNELDTKRRVATRSTDGGETFGPSEIDEALIEPRCQGSALRLDDAPGGATWVVFSNPASTVRERLTVRYSADGARTWSAGRLLHAGPAAYSDLCQLPDGRLGCLYESGDDVPYERLTWARFDAAWLAEPDD